MLTPSAAKTKVMQFQCLMSSGYDQLVLQYDRIVSYVVYEPYETSVIISKWLWPFYSAACYAWEASCNTSPLLSFSLRQLGTPGSSHIYTLHTVRPPQTHSALENMKGRIHWKLVTKNIFHTRQWN